MGKTSKKRAKRPRPAGVGAPKTPQAAGMTAVKQARPQPPVSAQRDRPGARWKIVKPERFLAFLTVLALLILLLVLLFTRQGKQEAPAYEPNVTVGAMPGKSQEALQAELNQAATEKTFAVNYNYMPSFEDGTAEGPILFENSTFNAGKLLRLEIYVGPDDTGLRIYQTGLLRSGTYVNEDALDVDLAAGTYDCTAYIYAYRESDEGYIGKVNGDMVVTVLH